MKTLTLVACLGLVAFAGAAFATEFVWTGGASGDWTAPGNWSVGSGYPKAGDTAVFNETVMISGSDFDIGGEEGTTDALTIDIAEGKTLTVDVSISGNGGVTRSGEGTLKLNRANPFRGEYLSRNASKQANGRTYVYNQDALGTKSANFREDPVPAGTKNYAPLFIDAGGGAFTFSVPIRICNNNNDGSDGLYLANGKFIFTSAVTAPGRFHGSVSNVTEIRFKEKFTVGGWCDMTYWPSTCHVYFEKGFTSNNSTWLLSGSSAVFHFPSADNNIYFGGASGYGPAFITIVCETEDVITGSKQGNLFWENKYGTQTPTMKIDLGGYDQHYAQNLSGGSVMQGNNFGYTSAAPAQVILAGSYTKDLAFNGNFWGAAGLTWNPSNGTTEFILTNVVSSTKGSLRALSGAIRLSDGSSFFRLAEIEIGETGAFVLNDDAGLYTFASNVLVAAGGALAIPAGRTVSCYTCFDENGRLANGLYKAGETGAPAFLSGEGVLEVNDSPLFKWVGGAAGNWSDGANWDLEAVPGENARVVIDGGVNVTLDQPSARLASLTVADGTLTIAAGWDTIVLQADEISVASTGTITTPGAFNTAEDAPASRVNIVCGDLTIAAGGKIDVAGKGWAGGKSGVAGLCGISGVGYGPGATLVTSAGSSHGGLGAVYDMSVSYDALSAVPRGRFGFVYDDPYAPVLPGSGSPNVHVDGVGGKSYAGGGAVRIVATGTVTVDGSILASAPDEPAYDTSMASGGSVWITCATFSGSGVVEADGGSPIYGAYPGFLACYAGDTVWAAGARGGGGGMIRIECDAVGGLSGMRISAAPGYFLGKNGVGRLTAVNYDKYRVEADLGTLTFNNNLILDALLGKGLSGRLVGVTNYTYATDLDWTWGHVRFAGEGANVAFGGDLTITGEDSRLEIGGIRTLDDHEVLIPTRYAGTVLNRCTIAGSLTLDGGAFDIRAAAVSGEMKWGGEVTVGGDLTVGAGGYLYPWCDVRTLGSPHFTVGGAFTVAEGGTVMADRRGGAAGGGSGGYSATQKTNQRGWLLSSECHSSGPGASSSRGASHGGVGGDGWAEQDGVGATNGSGCKVVLKDEWTADIAGSGGGAGGYGEGGCGGGLVYVEAKGALTVDGTVSANGICGYYASLGASTTKSLYAMIGSGSGGGIHLSGASFAGTGTITARGGNATSGYVDGTGAAVVSTFGYAAGCGGGGRIVIATGADVEGKIKLLQDMSADYKSDPVVQELNTFTGTIDANGGTNVWTQTGKIGSAPQFEASWGGDGTVRYLRTIPAPGVLLLVR